MGEKGRPHEKPQHGYRPPVHGNNQSNPHAILHARTTPLPGPVTPTVSSYSR